MTEIFLNGKFTRQRMTGVQRVAREITAALDRRLAGGQSTPRCTLLLPPGAQAPALDCLRSRVVAGPHNLQLWEQVTLPLAARGGILLNLSGAAPAFLAGRQACVLHDAAVFDHPEAYSPAFVRWYRWLFRHHARRRTTLITVSAFSRERLAAALGVPPSRFAVIPLGADHLDRCAPDPAVLTGHGLLERPFLLAVGSANPTKNLAALIRVWRHLRRSDARLVIAGGANARVFAVGGLPEASGVIALGPIDDATLKALYGAAAGLVFPSLYEGFGLPPLEAMACGCAVACSDAASLPEVCGDAALSFDPHDDAAMAAAMCTLLDDGAARERLRVLGRVRAGRFRWDAAGNRLLAALEAAE